LLIAMAKLKISVNGGKIGEDNRRRRFLSLFFDFYKDYSDKISLGLFLLLFFK